MRFRVQNLVGTLLAICSFNLLWYVYKTSPNQSINQPICEKEIRAPPMYNISEPKFEKTQAPLNVMQIRRDRFERNAKLDNIFDSIGKSMN